MVLRAGIRSFYMFVQKLYRMDLLGPSAVILMIHWKQVALPNSNSVKELPEVDSLHTDIDVVSLWREKLATSGERTGKAAGSNPAPRDTCRDVCCELWQPSRCLSPSPTTALSPGRRWDLSSRHGRVFQVRVHSCTLAAEHVVVQKRLGDLGVEVEEERGCEIPRGSPVLDGSKRLLTAKLSSHHSRGLARGSLHPSVEKKKFLLSLLEREGGRERKTLWVSPLISKTREIWKEQLKARATGSCCLRACHRRWRNRCILGLLHKRITPWKSNFKKKKKKACLWMAVF